MNVCKCIVPLRHGGTLNSRRATSPLVRLVDREERWEAPDPQGVLPQNCGRTELSRTVTCSAEPLLGSDSAKEARRSSAPRVRNELKPSLVTCRVLKTTANDRSTSSPLCQDEFRGPRSNADEIRFVAMETTSGLLNESVCKKPVQIRTDPISDHYTVEARPFARFVEWAQNEIAVVPDFHKRILFSDEAHFWLNGYVNKQNCRIWSEANPQVYVETPLHPEKLTVSCALWAGGIIGPYFKNDEGHNVTVNGDRYRAMITNFFIPELNNHDVQELWFQQDGATCHTARATIDLLKDTFGDCLISRFGPVNWSPRSCDLTPLDYFLWGYVKSLVYADKPQTLDHLEDNIRRVIADIRPQMLEKVRENWTSRLDYIRASRGSPMPEIIFKM
ncbi:putative transposase [Trichonephila clavipes]|nr:putative transposase [Trichonephila clavipes]